MASTILVNTIDTQSGSTITVPTGKTLAVTDTGALTIGGTAITTGAQGVISKTAAYTILPADFTGKSSLIVFVNVSAGTSTETIITLPAAADFGTCAIHVVSTTTHGAGNYITIQNSSAVEQYTLYNKQDHCEVVSDATNIFRTGNEFVTIRSQIALTANVSMTTASTKDIFNAATATNYSVVENIGSGWNSTTHDYIVPYTGLYRFGGHANFTSASYQRGWALKKNAAWVTNLATGYNGDYDAGGNTIEFPMSLTAGDSIEFWMSNHSGTHSASGNATSTNPRCRADCWMLRRY
jgi:hypothetical protein